MVRWFELQSAYLVEGGGEGRVAHDPRLFLPRARRPLGDELADGREVGEAARGVGRRLRVHHLGVGPQGLGVLLLGEVCGLVRGEW